MRARAGMAQAPLVCQGLRVHAGAQSAPYEPPGRLEVWWRHKKRDGCMGDLLGVRPVVALGASSLCNKRDCMYVVRP